MIIEYGNPKDKVIVNILKEVKDILYKLDTIKDNILSEELIEQIKSFYSIEENIIFTNYMSEIEEKNRKKEITSNFLKNIKSQFFHLNFNYISDKNNKQALDDYIILKKKKFKRLFLSSIPEVLKWDLNDEIIIFSMVDNNISHGNPIEYEYAEKFKENIKNLKQDKILNEAREILNDNNFYEYFFDILKSKKVKKFFNNLILTKMAMNINL